MENGGLSKSLEMKKKGMFFTISVVLILGLFLASFGLYEDVEDRKAIQKRVETMNSFMESVEKDLSRKLYISTYRAVFLAESKIISDKAYISDLNDFFNDAFIKGEVNGNYTIALDGYNVSAIVEDVRGDSELVGANFIVNSKGAHVVISQNDPWHIKATLILNMSLTDLSGLAKMDKMNAEIYAYVPITNFEDPMYFIETSGSVSNFITRSTYTFSNTDYTNLSRHANNSYYVANSAAPSFLNRLQGNFSGDVNGIESFVNLQKLQIQGVNIDSGKSIIDYIYFNEASDPGYYTIPAGTMTLSWFKVDNSTSPQRLILYNISGQVGPN